MGSPPSHSADGASRISTRTAPGVTGRELCGRESSCSRRAVVASCSRSTIDSASSQAAAADLSLPVPQRPSRSTATASPSRSAVASPHACSQVPSVLTRARHAAQRRNDRKKDVRMRSRPQLRSAPSPARQIARLESAESAQGAFRNSMSLADAALVTLGILIRVSQSQATAHRRREHGGNTSPGTRVHARSLLFGRSPRFAGFLWSR
jgi:hypothetical protein